MVAFHPVVSSSLAGFLVFVFVVVFVRVLIVTDSGMVIVIFFHPKVASGLTGFLVFVFVVVLVSVHVVTHTVLIVFVFAVLVVLVVLVVLIVIVVVMVVSATHGGNGHLERFHLIFGFKLQHVGALFEMID